MPYPWTEQLLPPPFNDIANQQRRQVVASMLNDAYMRLLTESGSPEDAEAGALAEVRQRLETTGDLQPGDAGDGRQPKVVIKVFAAEKFRFPYTAEALPPDFVDFPQRVKEDAADLANAVYQQAVADGAEEADAVGLALNAAMEMALEAVGAKPEEPPVSSRPPVDSVAEMGAGYMALVGDAPPPATTFTITTSGSDYPARDDAIAALMKRWHAAVPWGWEAFKQGIDGAITSCVFRSTPDDGTERTLEYRGTTYVRGPFQPVLAAGEHFRGRGRKVVVTREHLAEMARNAVKEQTLIPVNFAHQGDGDLTSGRALGLLVNTSLRVVGDTLFARVAYTASAAEMVRAGELPGISAEFSLGATSTKTPDDKGEAKSIGAVLFGAGLLTQPQLDDLRVITKFGANTPEVSENETPTVSAYRTPRLTVHQNSADTSPTIGTLPTFGDDMADPIKFNADTLTALGLTDGDELTKFDAAVKVQADKIIAKEAEVATLKESLATADSGIEKLTAERDKATATLSAEQAEVVKLSGRVEALETKGAEQAASIAKAGAEKKVQAVADERSVHFGIADVEMGVKLFLADDDDAAKRYLGAVGQQRTASGERGENAPDKPAEWAALVELTAREKFEGDLHQATDYLHTTKQGQDAFSAYMEAAQ